MKLLVDQSGAKGVAYAVGLLAATHCAVQLVKASSDRSEGASALLACVGGASETITTVIAHYMADSPTDAASDAPARTPGARRPGSGRCEEARSHPRQRQVAGARSWHRWTHRAPKRGQRPGHTFLPTAVDHRSRLA